MVFPTTSDALLIILIFIVPGYLSDRILRLFIPGGKREAVETILNSITLSVLNYWLASLYSHLFSWGPSPPVDLQGNSTTSTLLLVGTMWAYAILHAVTLPLVFGRRGLQRWYQRFGMIHPVPKSWDYVFSRNKHFMLRVTLADGSQVGGRWGSESYASGYPADEDVYLEQRWTLRENGEFLAPDPGVGGMLIRGSQIKYMEILPDHMKGGITHGQG